MKWLWWCTRWWYTYFFLHKTIILVLIFTRLKPNQFCLIYEISNVVFRNRKYFRCLKKINTCSFKLFRVSNFYSSQLFYWYISLNGCSFHFNIYPDFSNQIIRLIEVAQSLAICFSCHKSLNQIMLTLAFLEF